MKSQVVTNVRREMVGRWIVDGIVHDALNEVARIQKTRNESMPILSMEDKVQDTREKHERGMTAVSSIRYCEIFIQHLLEHVWDTPGWLYYLEYLESTHDAWSRFHYFKVELSKPSKEYPVPQAVVNVIFIAEECMIYGDKQPLHITCRFEGFSSQLDARHFKLIKIYLDRILQMKIHVLRKFTLDTADNY